MSDTTYSFVYDRASADAAFHGIATRELVLSMLAGIPPEPTWEGSLVYSAPSPVEGPTVCLGTRGPGADELQLRLIEALERTGVRVLEVYEGGPDVDQPIAVARGSRWSTP
jgi:hypothetical protein